MKPFQFAEFLAKNNDNYEICEEKGQRIFRPKDPSFETDPAYDQVKKHEIFLSNLPNDCFENELLPFLCRAGAVYVIRSIMNFSGLSKGMVFVIFARVEYAYEAVEILNGQYIRCSGNGCHRRVKVCFSVNNNRLLLRNIPENKSSDDVKRELEKSLNGIVAVKLYNFENNCNAMITFESHSMAASARRALVPKASLIKIFGQKLDVEWAKPKDSKSLFVRFNSSFFNQTLVKNFFENKFSSDNPISVTTVKITGKNAFVKFQTYFQASYVLKKSKLMPESDFVLKDYLEIERLSWPDRK